MIDAEYHALFRRLVGASRRFVLATHLNPDGDALGSQISLARFLVSHAKHVRIVNHDPAAENLRFIAPAEIRLEIYDSDEHDASIREVDLVVLVDNSAPDRLGRMEPIMREVADRTLCIDHHPTRDAPWAHNILDTSACATAVLIYELTQAEGWVPDPQSAEAIYTGLTTDTGFFRFNSTNPRAHEVAAELLRLGVRPSRAYGEVYEQASVQFTRLLGHALTTLRIDGGGAVASVRITADLVRDLGAENVDSSEVTTVLLAIKGVQVVTLFRELPDGRIKVSLRSKGCLDVHQLAAEFGGGGHKNASGIVTVGTLDVVAETIDARVVSRLAEGAR